VVTAIVLAITTFGPGVPDFTACQDSRAIRLQIIRAAPITDETLDTILGEAIAIWAPYDVWLCPVLSLSRPNEDQGKHWIKLVIRDAPANRIDGRTPRGYRALASLMFKAPDTPADNMYASIGTARQEVAAARFDHFPPVIRERLAAQLLGRAIAHELGHYLLASTRHSRKGLMRASLSGSDLLTVDAGAFRLEPQQAAALAARMQTTSRMASSSPSRK
jgi:hypothetical protein